MPIDAFSSAAVKCTSAEEIDKLFLNACARSGHTYVMYGNFLALDGFESGIRLNTFPAEWWATYENENLQAHDPTLKGLLYATTAFGWNDFVSGDEREMDMMKRAEDFGMTNGLICPIRVTRGEFYAVSLSGAYQPADPLERVEIAALANIFHSSRLQFETPQERASAALRLTATQTEYLRMMAEGYTIDAIASKKGITASGVNKRLGEAYRKLGTSSATFAVSKAIAYGVISPSVVRPWLQDD